MLYLIYKITNLINGKIYIGKHKTLKEDDGYMGSGTSLKRSINEYGIENFKKEILYRCNTEEEMNEKEAEIVNEDFIKRKDTYNIALGGKGGDCKAAVSTFKILIQNKEWYDEWYQKLVKANSDENNRKKVSDGLKNYYKIHQSAWVGKQHTAETKEKMSKKAKERNIHGAKNPRYGKHWIINPNTMDKKVVSEKEILKYFEHGYILGRSLSKRSLTEQERKEAYRRGHEKQCKFEQERVKQYGKKVCYINKQTGERKYFRESQVSEINTKIWKPTWSHFNVEEIKSLHLQGLTWQQVADYYNTTYWSIYSWYLDNKELFGDFFKELKTKKKRNG